MRASSEAWDGTRESWTELGERLVAGALKFHEPSSGRIVLPGQESKHGAQSDAMEGFARVFLLHSFLESGTRGSATAARRDRFLTGLAAGVEGRRGHRQWLEPADKGHATVEAASIALGLWSAREWTWDRLTDTTRDQLAEWLAECAAVAVPDNNWILFSALINEFLQSVDAPVIAGYTIGTALDHLESWPGGEGWRSDGKAGTFDYYNSWALQFYPAMIGHLSKDQAVLSRVSGRLSEHVRSLAELIDSSGSPVLFGRSLTYRFAMTAAFAGAALADCLPFPPATARDLSNSVVRHFLTQGAVGRDDILSVGWWGPSDAIAQDYSGPGAPYWSSKAFANLLLPPTHEYWQGRPSPSYGSSTPVHLGDSGMLAAASPGREVVRLFNHGSTARNSTMNAGVVEDPWYSRQSYSSASAPVESAVARSGALVFHIGGDLSGRGRVEFQARGIGWASSRSRLRVTTTVPVSEPEYTRRKQSHETRLPVLSNLTWMSGSWAVEVVSVDHHTNQHVEATWAGLAVSTLKSDEVHESVGKADSAPWSGVSSQDFTSVIVGLLGFHDAGTEQMAGGPLGNVSHAPVVRARAGTESQAPRWFAVATYVSRSRRSLEEIAAMAPRLVTATERELTVRDSFGTVVDVSITRRGGLIATVSKPLVSSTRPTGHKAERQS